MARLGDGEFHDIPSARPALIALAVVVALAFASTISTLVVSRETAERTRSIVDNAMRSVELVGHMRGRVKRLPTAPATQRTVLERQIDEDIRLYDALVTPAERAEWTRLKPALLRYVNSPRDAVDGQARLDRLADSFDRLAEINTREARLNMTTIDAVHRNGLIFEIVEGLLVFVIAGGVAVLLVRVVRQQRRMSQSYLDVLLSRNRDLDAFASRTAHDLRGPLGPILGYSEMIASGVPIESKHAAMKIQHAARSMAAMIDNLLMLSASGDMPRGEVEVAPLVATVVGELRPTLRDAAVVTEVGECKAACPPSVLESVVRNIVTNASKYRSPGRRLEVRIVATCAGPWIELAVTDNGLGMSPEDVACAFEPRFRAASTAGVPGHGLGLSIVERMVESIGGSCELTSELGKGTRVVVRIPAAH